MLLLLFVFLPIAVRDFEDVFKVTWRVLGFKWILCLGFRVDILWYRFRLIIDLVKTFEVLSSFRRANVHLGRVAIVDHLHNVENL